MSNNVLNPSSNKVIEKNEPKGNMALNSHLTFKFGGEEEEKGVRGKGSLKATSSLQLG